MSYLHNTPENISLLSKLTGIPAAVCDRWLRCEAQSRNNPTNPLNILTGVRKYPDRPPQIGANGRFGVYATVEDGIGDAAWLINKSSYYAGIRRAIKTGDPLTIARAIEDSPWAGGHYGHSCLSSHFSSSTPNVPLPVTPPVPPTPSNPVDTYVVRPGDTLSEIAAKYLGGASNWRRLYDLNRQVIGTDPNLIHPGMVLKMPADSTHPTTDPSTTYTVKAGDSLWTIATKLLGNGARWNEIYQANRNVISNPSLIHVGMKLRIPPK